MSLFIYRDHLNGALFSNPDYEPERCEECGAGFCKRVPWEDMDEKEHDKKCFEVLKELWNKRYRED